MTPEELNETTDAALLLRVDAIIAEHSTDGAERTVSRESPSPFMTYLLLFRLRTCIVRLIKDGQCRLAKQK
eukprot:677305-Prymnesium_polylepis.1